MERPRLSYFDMRGRAEGIRVFLHATGSEFEDQRIVSSDEWTALKSTLPFGALPVYESQQLFLCHSHAILRYLGRQLSSADPDERNATELDVAQEAIAEAQEDLWRFNWVKNYYQRLESYADETLRRHLQGIESWLTRDRSGDRQWFGVEFSSVDCVAFSYLDEVDAFFPAVLAEFSRLSKLHADVASISGVSNYLESPNRPMVFGMGCMGPKVDPRSSFPAQLAFANPWTDPIDLTEALRGQRRLTGHGN